MGVFNINNNLASETAKGVVEEATQAEVDAGTDIGGTLARLFVVPSKLLALLATRFTGVVNRIPYWGSTTALTNDANFTRDATTKFTQIQATTNTNSTSWIGIDDAAFSIANFKGAGMALETAAGDLFFVGPINSPSLGNAIVINATDAGTADQTISVSTTTIQVKLNDDGGNPTGVIFSDPEGVRVQGKDTGAVNFAFKVLGGNAALGNGSTLFSVRNDGLVSTSAGQVATLPGTETLTNKRITARTGTVASSATPTINTDNVDFYSITALAANITSFTTNLSGTPTEGQTLWIAITDNGTARTLTWGASFESSGNITLPTTTVISTRLDVGFIWNTVTSKWRCVGKA